jgi:hypothetical protein
MTVWCADVQNFTPDGHLYRVTYTRCGIDTINSPDDGHMAARNTYRIEINIHEKGIVRQVGYLQIFHVFWIKEILLTTLRSVHVFR